MASTPIPATTASEVAHTHNSLSPEQKYELITQNLQEVLGGDALKEVLKTRDAVAYWGTAPTGRPHLGYFVPIAKLGDFLTAGVQLKILLADVHAFLDNLKAPIELVHRRVDYYRHLITAVFRSLHLPLSLVQFVVGSSYQHTPKYNFDILKLTSMTTLHDAKKAGADVVKEVESPLMSGMLYPLLQALDEEYLGVDLQFGGVDQRKIFTYAELYLPKMGYSRRTHLMNKMVPGLSGGKMSSSDPDSKIDFLDSPEQVKNKIKKALCTPGEVEGNGVLAFVRSVIVPIGELMRGQGRGGERKWTTGGEESVFTVVDEKAEVRERHFKNCEELEEAYKKEEVHPGALKIAVVGAINALLEPIQKEFEGSEEWQIAEREAYPKEVKAGGKKKEKKAFVSKEEGLRLKKEKEEREAAAAGKAEEKPLENLGDLKDAIAAAK